MTLPKTAIEEQNQGESRVESDVEKQIQQFILENYLFTDDSSSLGREDSLLELGVVDSTGMLEIIFFLEEDLGINVDDSEMIPANLDSIANLTAYVLRKHKN